MLSIAVCDDNMIACSRLSGKIHKIMEFLGQSVILKQFASGREWDRMKLYLEQMSDSCGLGIGDPATGNRVVDILLEQKEGQSG